jgi:glycosyltransferase involved in cell wall biosynthesis
LTNVLVKNIDKEDEIVICVDGDDDDVKLVLSNFKKTYGWKYDIIVYNRKLDGNFADHKNSVIEKSTGDYVFHIDADEYPHEILLQQLKQILEINDVDLIWIPRVNTVEGFTQQDIQKWGWNTSEKGWVNYPDYQSRVYKRKDTIRWERPLHELIKGAKTYSHLPPHEELSLYHPKTKEKQEAQNKFYMENFSKELLTRLGQ